MQTNKGMSLYFHEDDDKDDDVISTIGSRISLFRDRSRQEQTLIKAQRKFLEDPRRYSQSKVYVWQLSTKRLVRHMLVLYNLMHLLISPSTGVPLELCRGLRGGHPTPPNPLP